MSSKENLKRCGSTPEKENVGSKKSKLQEECYAEKAVSDEAKQVQRGPATSPSQAVGRSADGERSSSDCHRSFGDGRQLWLFPSQNQGATAAPADAPGGCDAGERSG